MSLDLHAICARLGLATLNGVYQGIILSIFVAAGLRLLLRSNAATRHAVWFASLWLVALIIPAHCWLDRPARNFEEAGDALVTSSRQSIIPDQVLPAFAESYLIPFNFDLGTQSEEAILAPAPALSVPPADSLSAPMPAARLDSLGGPAPRAMPRFIAAAQTFFQRFIHPVSWTIASGSAFPVLAALLLLWLAIGGIRLAILAGRLRQVCQFSEQSSPPDAELLARFSRLRQEGRVRRDVDLRISVQQRCPLVLGFFHPVVLLPAEMAATEDKTELDHVLRHELAHVRRYDDWANLAQHFVQALLFFHPSVWWISRRLSLEREIACDDHVLNQGGGRRHYALILTTVASRLNQMPPMLSPGVSNSNNQLQERINMILNTRRNASPGLAPGWSASIISATVLLAVLALYSGPRLVLAAAPAASISTDTAAISVSSTPSVSAVEWNGQPTASVAVVASVDAPVQVSADVGPGPKFKPEAPEAELSGDDQLEPPEPSEGPSIHVAPKPPVAPRVARAGKPAKAPRAPEAPDAMNKDDGSVEDRLRRLEKMMAELMDQQGPKRVHGAFAFKEGTDMKFNFSPEQMDKMKQATERQAARAAEQAKRAKELEARLEQEQSSKGESLQWQLESLRKAREGLGQEMERLSRQIDKLEREQQRNDKNKDKDKDPERRSDVAPGKLRAQASSAAQVAQ